MTAFDYRTFLDLAEELGQRDHQAARRAALTLALAWARRALSLLDRHGYQP